MLRNSNLFCWEWRGIHLYFHNRPIKHPSYVRGNCKTFHWTSWGVFVQIKRGKKGLFSCQRSCGTNQLGHSFSSRALRKQWTKNRKKTPKMKCQLFRALFLLLQRHFSVPWLLFSCDNPRIKEKAAFPNRKQRKAGEFPFSFFSVLVAYLWARGQRVFHTLDFCGINKDPFPRGKMGDDDLTVESHSSLCARPRCADWISLGG